MRVNAEKEDAIHIKQLVEQIRTIPINADIAFVDARGYTHEGKLTGEDLEHTGKNDWMNKIFLKTPDGHTNPPPLHEIKDLRIVK